MSRRIAFLAAGLAAVAGVAVVSPAAGPPAAAPTTEAVATTAGAAPVAAVAPAEPAVHWSEPHAYGLAPTATSGSTATYKFSVIYNSKVVRWNPCQAIHWKFRSSGAPSGGFNVVKAAVARVAYLTGTRWVYDGTVTTHPSSKWLPTSTTTIRPVLIGWTRGKYSDLLAGQAASVLGVTRTAYFTSTVNGTRVAATKAAVIALDNTNSLPMTGAVSWKSTMLHELGHLMGMDHVGTTSQMMYPVLQRSHTDFQSGDRTGLSKVGRNAGCVNLGF